jgi:hypothetical protein
VGGFEAEHLEWLFGTPCVIVKQRPFGLDASGEGGRPKAMRLEGLQQTLFACHETWG